MGLSFFMTYKRLLQRDLCQRRSAIAATSSISRLSSALAMVGVR